MPKTVFFSWQADTPNRTGRTFLRSVLDEVQKSIAEDTSIDEALREIAVDSDTQGVAGQPPIVETIFKKIDSAGVFLADMTFTGMRSDKRPTPNPNVLIEYGWALKALTHGRVISVMNIAHGKPSHDTLPFDLAHLRWPITYTLPENASAETVAGEKRKLIETLKGAILASLATIPEKGEKKTDVGFPMASAKDGAARFRSAGESIGILDDNFEPSKIKIMLAEGSSVWLRLMPISDIKKQWPTHELKKLATGNDDLFPLYSGAGSYSSVRSSDGEGIYRTIGGDSKDVIHVRSVSFAFRTGEIWSIDTSLFSFDKNTIAETALEDGLVDGLQRYAKFLNRLGLKPPYRWIAGVEGIKERHLEYAVKPGFVRIGPGPVCMADVIESNGEYDPKENATTALLPFFQKVFEECGIVRPDYLSQ